MRTIKLGDWEFQITEQAWGTYVSVPDMGGMADSLPRDDAQLAWAEAAFAELPALKQVWPTTWEIAPGALPQVEAWFERKGAHWD
jgi:hypothetical protein